MNANTIKATILSLLGYLSVAVMSACAKAIPGNVSIATIIFFQSLIALLITSPPLLKGDIKVLKVRRPFLLLLRCFSGLLTFAALFFAIRHIPLVDAVLLQNSAPLFVPLLILLSTQKAIAHKLWLPLIVGFLGVILILKPNTGIFNPAAIIALLAGLATAITIVAIGVLKKTESTNNLLFYYFLFTLLVSLPIMIWQWVPLNLTTYLWLLATGISMYLGQWLITHAFAYGKASMLAPFCYTAVVFTGLIEWAVWKHIPDTLAFTGILLVVIGGIATIILNQQKIEAEAGLTNEG